MSTAVAPGVETPRTEPPSPARPRFSRTARNRLRVIVLIAALIGLGIGGHYVLFSAGRVSVENAQIDGDPTTIAAPATGTLVEWKAVEGTSVRRNQEIGRIRIGASTSGPQRVLRAPADGTVGVSAAVPGVMVHAGQLLATAYDLKKVYATARVEETDVGGVRPGERVDIDVDAFPDAHVTGVVDVVQNGSAAQFSLLPQANTNGDFQKVTQVIPVRILLLDTDGVRLVPGMTITAHIQTS